MRVLIIDRDEAAGRLAGSALRNHGFLCDVAVSGFVARDMIATIAYAAIVLDLALHDADDMELLRELRGRRPGTPVIVVGASADARYSIAALDAGADDCLRKPFDPDELAARLRAVLRRGRRTEGGTRFGDLIYDPGTQEVVIGGAPVALSARERQLFGLLMQGGGRLVTKAYAEDQLFGHSLTLGSNAIEVYAHRLRRRLREAGSPVRIESVRGVGYVLRADAPVNSD